MSDTEQTGPGVGGRTDRSDLPCLDRDPSADELATISIEGRHQPRGADQQVGHGSGQRVDDDADVVDGCERVDDAQPQQHLSVP